MRNLDEKMFVVGVVLVKDATGILDSQLDKKLKYIR